MRQKIKISQTTIKEALAFYLNNIDANLELGPSNFQLKADVNRKVFWAIREETGHELYERGACPFCYADTEHVKDEEDECEVGILINKKCDKCHTRWQK